MAESSTDIQEFAVSGTHPKNVITRRDFMRLSAGGVSALGLGGCSYDPTAYREALAQMTRPLPGDADARELIRYATLAANGHNTQPWRFRLQDRSVALLPDFTRRTSVVDPDDHHLFASLGCAAENLSIAARARGLSGDVQFDATGQGELTVDLSDAPHQETGLFAAIPARQCDRVAYDGKTAPPDVMRRLERAASCCDVETVFVSDKSKMEAVLALVVEGNSLQMDDPAFVAELKAWIRFNPEMALSSRDGLYGASSGNPVLPAWLGSLMFDQFFAKKAENDKYAEHIRSSAGIAVFVAGSDDRAGWANAGRACQRFALQATADGLKHAFINQPVEVPEVRTELRPLLRLGNRRPNLIVRFGYGPSMPRSLRRPVDEVLI